MTCNHPRVTLVDGTTTCTWSEAWRAECEARMICNLATLADRRKYLFRVFERRGEQHHAQLKDLVRQVWMQLPRPAGGVE